MTASTQQPEVIPAPGIDAMHCCWHCVPVRPVKYRLEMAPLVHVLTSVEYVHVNGGGDGGGGGGDEGQVLQVTGHAVSWPYCEL